MFVDSMAIGSGQISKNFDADHLLSLSNAEKIKKMSHCMSDWKLKKWTAYSMSNLEIKIRDWWNAIVF